MQLKKSKREDVKLRVGISGASGFGKTYSALLLAYGITKDWNKIAVIDTENSSASLYSHLGPYNVLELSAPFSPERYVEAIGLCEKENMQVIIIDSISHEWNGTGGCLQLHEQLGGRFQDWGKISPRHQAFIDKILQSSCHVITTSRRKIDYSLDVGFNGRTKVVKHGTKEVTRDGFEYELTVNFELINDQHMAKASKDRTGLFSGKPEFKLSSSTGARLIKWCQVDSNLNDDFTRRIGHCLTMQQLLDLYKASPQFQETHKDVFQKRKVELEQLVELKPEQKNGTH